MMAATVGVHFIAFRYFFFTGVDVAIWVPFQRRKALNLSTKKTGIGTNKNTIEELAELLISVNIINYINYY